MIAVEAAQAECLALVRPTPAETVGLRAAAGRVLAECAVAGRAQPPFPAAAMDGYALAAEAPEAGARFAVIGEAAAGHGWAGTVGPGEAVRIFTGAPCPPGTARVVVQEDVDRDGDTAILRTAPDAKTNIRAEGSDFAPGFALAPPRRLAPADLALLAAMNVDRVHVRRRPVVALIATGDELVMPGAVPGPDQIIASNLFALEAMLAAEGAAPRLLPIARDSIASLRTVLALAADADLVVTIGGASVGDHDLVARAAAGLGLQRAFYKVAMRPGKPLMAGRMGGAAMLGLPGNPVSAIVCGHVFMLPMVRTMLGLSSPRPRPRPGRLSAPVAANGPRTHYMRATITDADGPDLAPVASQDSARLTLLAHADALVIRPPEDPARDTGDPVAFLPLHDRAIV